jgi:hypothetical protein
VDAVALAAVITSGTVGFAAAGAAFYSAHRTAKTAREGRAEQRAADGYLKVLSLAEQEAQWLDAAVFNLGLDPRDDVSSVLQRDVPEPAFTDRATAAAMIAAFASGPVREVHAAWRQAADVLDVRMKVMNMVMDIDASVARPGTGVLVPKGFVEELTEDLQPKEVGTRKALAEAAAKELGHR